MTTSGQILPYILILLNEAQIFEPLFYEVFSMQVEVGLRWSELDRSKWSHLSGRQFLVRTAKRGNDRVVVIPDECNALYDHYLNGTPTMSFKYGVTRIFINKALYPIKLKNGKNDIDTHIFRHYVAKKLHEEGKSIPEISEFLGDKTPVSAAKYVYSHITILNA